MDHGRKPLARTTDLIVEELGDELLVYDEESDRGHCLSPTAATVWRRCDGRTPVDGLSAQLDLDAETVRRALDELTGCGLLEAAPVANGGTTRRELTVRLAKAGGAVAAAPLIVSIAAPTTAAAQSIPVFCQGAAAGCLGNCSSAASQPNSCRGPAFGCVCCQYDGLNCDDHGFSRPSNVKFCALVTDPAQCPQDDLPNSAVCGTPCAPRLPGQREGDANASQATGSSSPGATTEASPTTPSSPAPSTPSTEPVAPAPETPAPTPETVPAPAPEPTPAPVPEAAPTTTTTATP